MNVVLTTRDRVAEHCSRKVNHDVLRVRILQPPRG